MTNEEAITIIEEEAEYLYGDDKPYNRQAFDMAIEALKLGWTFVSERLPERSGLYLLWGNPRDYSDEPYCFIGEYSSENEEFGYWIYDEQYEVKDGSEILGSVYSEFREYEKVIAWMPEPVPNRP